MRGRILTANHRQPGPLPALHQTILPQASKLIMKLKIPNHGIILRMKLGQITPLLIRQPQTLLLFPRDKQPTPLPTENWQATWNAIRVRVVSH